VYKTIQAGIEGEGAGRGHGPPTISSKIKIIWLKNKNFKK